MDAINVNLVIIIIPSVFHVYVILLGQSNLIVMIKEFVVVMKVGNVAAK